MLDQYKIEIKWAVVFILTMLLWMCLERVLGWHDEHIDKHMYLTNLFAIPAILIYVLALRDKRENDYGGSMTYKQGFMSGLIMTVVITLITPFAQWIISSVITPHYFENAIAYSLETGYHKTLEEAERFFNLKSYLLQATFGAFFMGVLTSAVVAFFVRSKKSSDSTIDKLTY